MDRIVDGLILRYPLLSYQKKGASLSTFQIKHTFNILIQHIPFCFNINNKINRFIPSKHNDIHSHEHPSMATCFGRFLDHPQTNICLQNCYQCALYIMGSYTVYRMCYSNITKVPSVLNANNILDILYYYKFTNLITVFTHIQ
jgi:hypothetical protein